MKKFYLSAFLADFALGAVLLALPLLLIHKFQASSITLGLFGAFGASIYSLTAILTGRLADRFNRRDILISGCVLFVISYFLLPFANRLRYLFGIYLIASFSMAMFWPVIQSWLSQGLNKKNLLNSLKFFNIFWSAGLTLGFLLSGILFSINYRIPFIFGVLLMISVIIVLLRQPIISEIRDEPARKVFFETERERPKEALKFLYIAWAANFASWYIIGTVRNLFPRLGVDLGFSSAMIGIMVFSMMFTQTVLFFILGRTSRWHYRIIPILIFQLLGLVSLLIISISSSVFYLIIAFMLLGLCAGMTYFSSIFYSLYGFIDKGKRSGIHEGFIGAGAFLGPLAGGIVSNNFGSRSPYTVAFFLLISVIVLEIILWTKRSV